MDSTLQQIAKKAGVSETEVFKVLNDDPAVSEEMKRKVINAVSELTNEHDPSEQNQNKRRTETIAIVTAYMSTFSFYEVYLMNGFELQNIQMGHKYTINQYSTHGNDQKKKEFVRSILSETTADGMISMFLKFDDDDIASLRARNFPVVFIDEEAEGFHSITIDSYKGGYMATQHLISRGRKNIGLIIGQIKGEGVGITSMQRLNGYKQALAEHNIPFDDTKIIEVKEYAFKEGVNSLADMVRRKVKIDSIFCAAGDVVAMGVIEQANRAGINIPKDIALVGYDDINMASISKPALTTIHQPVEDMGKKAFELLVDTIEGIELKPRKIVLEPRLVVRAST